MAKVDTRPASVRFEERWIEGEVPMLRRRLEAVEQDLQQSLANMRNHCDPERLARQRWETDSLAVITRERSLVVFERVASLRFLAGLLIERCQRPSVARKEARAALALADRVTADATALAREIHDGALLALRTREAEWARARACRS